MSLSNSVTGPYFFLLNATEYSNDFLHTSPSAHHPIAENHERKQHTHNTDSPPCTAGLLCAAFFVLESHYPLAAPRKPSYAHHKPHPPPPHSTPAPCTCPPHEKAAPSDAKRQHPTSKPSARGLVQKRRRILTHPSKPLLPTLLRSANPRDHLGHVFGLTGS